MQRGVVEMFELILVSILSGLFGLAIGIVMSGDFFKYLEFKKKQEFEKEKYYSEYAEKYLKGGKR